MFVILGGYFVGALPVDRIEGADRHIHVCSAGLCKAETVTHLEGSIRSILTKSNIFNMHDRSRASFKDYLDAWN